jgi:T4 RnlA family RNA ligase
VFLFFYKTCQCVLQIAIECLKTYEKFFNLNENESTSLESIKSNRIKSVYIKEDGSIISFIKLPNGRVLAKSKTSFESDQAKSAQLIYETNPSIKEKINSWLEMGINPIFELVGPWNRIVINYQMTELKLIGLRKDDGLYESIESYPHSKSERVDLRLDEMVSLKSEIQNLEGWVVEFVDGKRIKIKTDWYFSLHRILTDYSNREDYLIDLILNEKIDDILSQLDVGSESRIFVESVVDTFMEKFDDIRKECHRIISKFDGDMKAFALVYRSHKYFTVISKYVRGGDLDDLLKEMVLKETYRLGEARTWLWGEEIRD